MQNRGGIRGGLDQGPISLERVREILPFQNKLIVSTVNGKTLMKALENSAEAASLGVTGGKFLEVHGLKFAWDAARPAGQRIVYAQAQTKEGNWEPVMPDDLYRIAMNDFSFNGGEEYDFKAAKDVVDTGLKLSTIFEDYLKKNKKVSPLPPSRFLLVSSTVAKRKTDGNSDLIAVDFPVPESEVSVITGSDRGVSFLNKTGTVPLEKPHLLLSLNTDERGHAEIPVSSLCQDKHVGKNNGSEHLWVAIVLKAKDKAGTTTKIVSLPIQIR